MEPGMVSAMGRTLVWFIATAWLVREPHVHWIGAIALSVMCAGMLRKKSDAEAAVDLARVRAVAGSAEPDTINEQPSSPLPAWATPNRVIFDNLGCSYRIVLADDETGNVLVQTNSGIYKTVPSAMLWECMPKELESNREAN